MIIDIVNISNNQLPKYETLLSAGMDLRAYLEDPIVLKPLQRALVKTGLFISLKPGYEAQVRPRSGLALKKGISVLNSPGTIDADYRGEIGVILINLSDSDFKIDSGDRIAQMVIATVVQPRLVEVENLSKTVRGEGGYGSTGANISEKIGAPQNGTD